MTLESIILIATKVKVFLNSAEIELHEIESYSAIKIDPAYRQAGGAGQFLKRLDQHDLLFHFALFKAIN